MHWLPILLLGLGICYPDDGYRADEKNVLRMGPVFISLSPVFISPCIGRNFPLLSSSPLIGQQQIPTNEARGKESGRIRFHPDNKIPSLYSGSYRDAKHLNAKDVLIPRLSNIS